jgi:hypothetical protein
MRVGIYIDGLGQAAKKESVSSYAMRLKDQYRFHTSGTSYECKIEKVTYGGDQEATVVSLVEDTAGVQQIIYKLYEFKYADLLTMEFNRKNTLRKSTALLWVVIKKAPVLFKRLFSRNNYDAPFTTFTIFLMFFLLAAAIIFTIPAALGLLLNFVGEQAVVDFIKDHSWLDRLIHSVGLTKPRIERSVQFFVSLIAIVLLIIPNANVLVMALATELVCANSYLEFGHTKQNIQGRMDQLVEFIVENEKEVELHFHAYSFGSVIALDYLFPYGTPVSGNKLQSTKALITIGSPVAFVNAYYTGYFEQRDQALDSKVSWLNVYSIHDPLGSNFRKDSKSGPAEFGVSSATIKPLNLNYEIIKPVKQNIFNFFLFNDLKMHGQYWGEQVSSNSCLGIIYLEMKQQGLL